MKALALDPGGLCGFAVGELGGQPRWGTHALGRGLSTGEALSGFASWLRDLIEVEAPAICCFESPYVPMRGAEIPRNAATVRRLHCYAGMIEAVCWRQGVEVYEARPLEIAKFFLGNARQGGRAAKKAATVKMCRLYGWDTVSDDAADALALFAYAEHCIAPKIGSRRSASARRELPLHGILTAVQEPRPFHEDGEEQHWPVAGVEASPVKRTSEKVKAGVRLTSPEPSSEGGPITRHGGEPRTVRHPP